MKFEIEFTEGKTIGMIMGILLASVVLISSLGFLSLLAESPPFALFVAAVIVGGAVFGWRKLSH